MSTKRWYIALLAAVIGLYLWSNAQPALLLACLMLVMLPVSVIENILAVRGLVVSVELQKQQESDLLVMVVRAENKSFLPVFRVRTQASVKNRLTGSSYQVPCEMGVAPRSSASREIVLESMYCGRLEGETGDVEAYDFLGFSGRRINGKSGAGCYAYPQPEEEDDWGIEQFWRDELETEERYTHTKGNDITEILNIREYQKGDNIKTIHWKLSKKLGYKVVKELDMPASQDVILLMALSHENASHEKLRHLVAQRTLNISQCLLQEQIFFDAVLIQENGVSHGTYTIQEQKTRDWYEQLLLDGNVEWEQDYVEQYIAYHHVLAKYATVILVTDTALEGWYQEHSQVLQICVA